MTDLRQGGTAAAAVDFRISSQSPDGHYTLVARLRMTHWASPARTRPRGAVCGCPMRGSALCAPSRHDPGKVLQNGDASQAFARPLSCRCAEATPTSP